MWKITSRFGDRESFRNSPHSGIDLKMEEGEKLYSINKGIIRTADYGSTNAGKTLFVEWEDGKTAIYGHLSKFLVKDGDIVEKGQLIALSGNTGFSTGAHLHFGIKENGKHIDPSPYIEEIQNMGKLIVTEEPVSIVEKGYSFLETLQSNQETVNGLLKMFTANFIDFI